MSFPFLVFILLVLPLGFLATNSSHWKMNTTALSKSEPNLDITHLGERFNTMKNVLGGINHVATGTKGKGN